MLRTPFYNPLKTYEENYQEGPFGEFVDGVQVQIGEAKFDFLGHKITFPLGIPAGPLLNGKYVAAAFEKGFDVPVYKTVRANEFPCHPFPNVLSVKVDGDLTLEKASKPLVADNEYGEPLSITNSFGVPSRPVDAWQQDASLAAKKARPGQVMIMSFMGTVREGQTAEEFIADFAKAAELSVATGASILEANLSCPNIGNEGLVCYNLDMTRRVTEAIRSKIGALPLVLKVGYYKDDESIQELAEIAKEYAQAISAINTVAAPIVDKDGNQALPGKVRLKSGVCGHAIKWAGLDMTRRLVSARQKADASFAIVGCGGVTIPEDFKEYREAGADMVMTATGAMWNPYLAKEIREKYPNA
jgi:dihydroorotate dehydrogenase